MVSAGGNNFFVLSYEFNCCTHANERIPDLLSVIDVDRVDADTSAYTWTTLAEYKLTRSIIGSISAAWKEYFEASASEEQKMVEEKTEKESQAVSKTMLRAIRYQVSLLPNAKLSKFLQNVLNELPTTLTRETASAYFDFFESYGSVVVKRSFIGASLEQLTSTDSSFLEEHTIAEVKKMASASFAQNIKLSGGTDVNTEELHQFKSESSWSNLRTRGVPPSADAMAFYASLGKTPYEILSWSGVPLADYLTSQNAPDVKNLQQLKANLNQSQFWFVTDRCNWDPTVPPCDRQVEMVISMPAPANQQGGPIGGATARLSRLLKRGESFDFTAPTLPLLDWGRGAYANAIPNVFRPTCVHTFDGKVKAQVQQGDGRGNWQVWGPNVASGLSRGVYPTQCFPSFQHCWDPWLGPESNTASTVTALATDMVCEGYHQYDILWKGDILAQVTCQFVT